jgi:hypothetical protein
MATRSWSPPAYQPANLAEMNREELAERKGDLERLVRRYPTTSPVFVAIDAEWREVVKLLKAMPAARSRMRSRTTRRRVGAAEALAKELKERKRALGNTWTINDTMIEVSNPEYREEVVLSAEARAAIEAAVYHSRISTLETGGPLGGRYANRRLRVSEARGAGSSKRGFNWIEVGGELQQFEADVEDTLGIDLVGDWHSHPRGRTQPSETDLVTWAKRLDGVERRHGTTTYVGMIAVPSPHWRDGSGRLAIPTLRAWLLRRVSPSLVTCERADIIGGSG